MTAQTIVKLTLVLAAVLAAFLSTIVGILTNDGVGNDPLGVLLFGGMLMLCWAVVKFMRWLFPTVHNVRVVEYREIGDLK